MTTDAISAPLVVFTEPRLMTDGPLVVLAGPWLIAGPLVVRPSDREGGTVPPAPSA